MNATPRLGANYIRDTTWFCCLALSVLVPLGDKVMQKHTLLLRQGSSMPTVKISIGHAGLFTICSSARNRDTVRDTFSLIQSTCIMAKNLTKQTQTELQSYLICNSTGQFVHPRTSLCNFLSRVDHI